jgi:hypothetical protein
MKANFFLSFKQLQACEEAVSSIEFTGESNCSSSRGNKISVCMNLTPAGQEMTYYYTESRRTGLSYIQYKKRNTN